MNYNDDEIKKLLEPLAKIQPNDLQKSQWKKTLQKKAEAKQRVSFSKLGWVSQLVAATIIGVVVGAFLLKSFSQNNTDVLNQNISFNNATFEHSHIKLD